MDWIQLKTGDILNSGVLGDVDWSHSFIREISLVSPSYILSEGRTTVAPDCLPSARVFISSSSVDTPGLELLFIEVDNFSVWFDGDLNPEISVSDDIAKFKFNRLMSAPTTCRSLYYRLLDNNTWGKDLRYGLEDIYDTGGELTIL